MGGLDRAGARRHLPALLRPHVHQSQGRAVRRGDGDRASRPRSRLRRISAPDPADARALRLGLRFVHRRARARRLRADGGAVSAAAHPCHQDARIRMEVRARRRRHVSGAVHSGGDLRLSADGPGLAVERGVAAQSVPRRRIFLDGVREAVARAVCRPVDPGRRHAAQLCADAVCAPGAGIDAGARPRRTSSAR